MPYNLTIPGGPATVHGRPAKLRALSGTHTDAAGCVRTMQQGISLEEITQITAEYLPLEKPRKVTFCGPRLCCAVLLRCAHAEGIT